MGLFKALRTIFRAADKVAEVADKVAPVVDVAEIVTNQVANTVKPKKKVK
jgi:hypothetical protein